MSDLIAAHFILLQCYDLCKLLIMFYDNFQGSAPVVEEVELNIALDEPRWAWGNSLGQQVGFLGLHCSLVIFKIYYSLYSL
jgi:hypothetical protein